MSGSNSSQARRICAGGCRAAYGLATAVSAARLNAMCTSGSKVETIRVPWSESSSRRAAWT